MHRRFRGAARLKPVRAGLDTPAPGLPGVTGRRGTAGGRIRKRQAPGVTDYGIEAAWRAGRTGARNPRAGYSPGLHRQVTQGQAPEPE